MPLPLLLAALGGLGGGASALGGALGSSGLGAALTGFSSGGLTGAGALSSAAGAPSFLSAPFGAAGFQGQGALSSLAGAPAMLEGMSADKSMISSLIKSMGKMGGGGGGMMMPFTKRQETQVGLSNQRSRAR